MAGLLRAGAAEKLVTALRERFDLPVHVHTHDTAGGQLATLLAASGQEPTPSTRPAPRWRHHQPALGLGLVAALAHTERDTGLSLARSATSSRTGRPCAALQAFESGLPGPDRSRLPARDPRRPAVQPAPAGDRAGARRPVREGRGLVRGREPDPGPRRRSPRRQGRRRPRPALVGSRRRPADFEAEPAAIRHPRHRDRLHGGRVGRPARRLAGALPHQGSRGPRREDRREEISDADRARRDSADRAVGAQPAAVPRPDASSSSRCATLTATSRSSTRRLPLRPAARRRARRAIERGVDLYSGSRRSARPTRRACARS